MSETKVFNVASTYYGSNGGATRSLLTTLRKICPFGRIAAELFRAQKASTRAKLYRGGLGGEFSLVTYRDLAYDAKQNALEKLCIEMSHNACGLKWGWGTDPKQSRNPHVLYVDLPIGQVSFHSPARLSGEDYLAGWDGMHGSESRIIQFCQAVLDGSEISGGTLSVKSPSKNVGEQ